MPKKRNIQRSTIQIGKSWIRKEPKNDEDREWEGEGVQSSDENDYDVCRGNLGKRSRNPPKRFENVSGESFSSDEYEGIKSSSGEPGIEEPKDNILKRHGIPMETTLDNFGVSTRERVGLSGITRNKESYCDMDKGVRERVVRAVLNLMGMVCRSSEMSTLERYV